MILAASDFVTVFEIARGSNGVFAGEVFRLLVGIAALIGGVTALIFKRINKELKSWVGPVFVTAWRLLWLYLHNFPYVFGHINNLVRAYRDEQYQIVEGPIQILHEQPATGHTKGDIFTANGKHFEVNYFYATPAYRNTLCPRRRFGRWRLCAPLLLQWRDPSGGHPQITSFRSRCWYRSRLLSPDRRIPRSHRHRTHNSLIFPSPSREPSYIVRSRRNTRSPFA